MEFYKISQGCRELLMQACAVPPADRRWVRLGLPPATAQLSYDALQPPLGPICLLRPRRHLLRQLLRRRRLGWQQRPRRMTRLRRSQMRQHVLLRQRCPRGVQQLLELFEGGQSRLLEHLLGNLVRLALHLVQDLDKASVVSGSASQRPGVQPLHLLCRRHRRLRRRRRVRILRQQQVCERLAGCRTQHIHEQLLHC